MAVSAEIAAPVAVVPYWTYLVPVAIAFIGLVNTLGLAYITAKFSKGKAEIVTGIDQTKKAVEESKEAVVVLEKQINSNLDKQIRASIAEAIATERLRVSQERK